MDFNQYSIKGPLYTNIDPAAIAFIPDVNPSFIELKSEIPPAAIIGWNIDAFRYLCD